MATIPTSEIIAELAKHPYKQTDKVQIGGSDHYVKVFVLGTQTPNGGDFVGQICVLTTGSTYVWTGSEWSSTAGSSTLPTPTSSNNGSVLTSNGSAWVASKAKGPVYGAGRSGAGDQSKYAMFKIGKFTGTLGTEVTHCSFDVQCGIHSGYSGHFHVDIMGYPLSSTLSRSVQITNVNLQSLNSSTMNDSTVKLKVLMDSSYNMYIAWPVILSSIRDCRLTIFDFICNAKWSPTFGTEVTVDDASSYTDFGTHTYKNVVPVSTASNQMLVSDGNGGWKVGAVQALEAETSTATHAVNKWCYKKIATHSSTSGHLRGQLTCRYTLGLHNTCSVSGDIKLECIFQSSTPIAMASITEVPSAQLNEAGSIGFKYLSEIFDVKFYIDYNEMAVYMAWAPKSTMSYGLNNSVKLTLDSIIADLDWTFATSTAWDGLDTNIPSSWVEMTKTSFMVPPATTTADNGKVLKVVSGVPTWATA